MKSPSGEERNPMPNLWITSDTHFGHQNIIKYCKRPFAGINDMDEAMIRNINEKVQPNDVLYHLGDWSFNRLSDRSPAYYRNRIKCKNIHLIMGNHDPHNRDGSPKSWFADLFSSVRDLLKIRVDIDGRRQEIVLCHYAMRIWNKSHHGVWHLYGHSHGTCPDDPHALSFDIGVDCCDFQPLSPMQISARMAKKKWKAFDHHGEGQQEA